MTAFTLSQGRLMTDAELRESQKRRPRGAPSAPLKKVSIAPPRTHAAKVHFVPEACIVVRTARTHETVDPGQHRRRLGAERVRSGA